MKNKFLILIVALIVLLVVAGCSTPNLSALTGPLTAANTPLQVPAASPVAPSNALAGPSSTALTDLQAAYEQIYNQVNPSVVLISVVIPGTSGGGRSPFGQGQQPQQQGLGSGFVWDKQGHIVTNDHVVDGASNIQVTFADGTTVSAKRIGTDPDSDLAVVQVNMPADALQPVQLADSTQVKVGQLTIAIGNPFGEQNTMTTGVVSGLGRSLPANNSNGNGNGNGLNGNQGPTYTIPDVIQTDAPINPGNSGGVLLDDQGQVIGVTSAIESPVNSSAGVGFAIPSAIVKQVIPALIQTGHFAHPYIGISGTSMTPDVAGAMGLNANQRGALVIDVTPGSPAAKAGLQSSTNHTTIGGLQAQVGGDVITAINGQPVKTFDDVIAYLARSTQVGQTITLTILRGGKQMNVQVTLQARPTSTSTLVQPTSFPLGVSGS